MGGIGGGYGQSKSESMSAPMMNLPWKEQRETMGKAKKRFIDPMLAGDYSAPAIQDMMNLTRGEAGKTTSNLMAKLAGTSGMSSPAKAALMGDSFGKINELAAGAGVKTFQDLMSWFDKIMSPMGQLSTMKSSQTNVEGRVSAGK